MLEQHHPAETSSVTPSLTPPSSSLPLVADVILARHVAQAEAGEREALRVQLRAYAAAQMELGMSAEQAVNAAIQQWESEQQAQVQEQALKRQQAVRRRTRSARASTRTALQWFGLSALLTVLLTPLILGSTNPLMLYLIYGLMFVLPAICGAVVGRRTPQRAVLGVFYAVLLLIPCAAAAATPLLWLTNPYLWNEGLWLGVDFLIFWMPIGCLAAAMTLWMRGLRRKRQPLAIQ